MNEHEILSNDINFFLHQMRAFTVQEVAELTFSCLSSSKIQSYLLNDKRFLHLSIEQMKEKVFISKKALVEWLAFLNVRLAKTKHLLLDKRQLIYFLNSLLKHGESLYPPHEIIQFGKRLGLIYFAQRQKRYVFPLAYILSFSPIRSNKYLYSTLMSALDDMKVPHEEFIQSIRYNCIAKLESRKWYVLSAKEGFDGKNPKTLKEIGCHLKLTRERVRQIYKAACESEFFFQPFLGALLRDIIQKHGGLTYTNDTTQLQTKRFFAKCLGIPQVSFRNLGLTVFGTQHLKFPPISSHKIVLDKNYVFNWLRTHNRLYLLDDDIDTLSEAFIAYWLNKCTLSAMAYWSLKHIGKPAHYSEVHKIHCSLFPERPHSERSIHAALLHNKEIVWVGAHGMYALKEWGCKQITQPLQDTVRDIVEGQYQKTKKPVRFEFIVTELGKYRSYIKPLTLITSICCNPTIQNIGGKLFVPTRIEEKYEEQETIDDLDDILREFEKRQSR